MRLPLLETERIRMTSDLANTEDARLGWSCSLQIPLQRGHSELEVFNLQQSSTYKSGIFILMLSLSSIWTVVLLINRLTLSVQW